LDNARDRQNRYWTSERRSTGVGLDNDLP
jgi:hypothetical protein